MALRKARIWAWLQAAGSAARRPDLDAALRPVRLHESDRAAVPRFHQRDDLISQCRRSVSWWGKAGSRGSHPGFRLANAKGGPPGLPGRSMAMPRAQIKDEKTYQKLRERGRVRKSLPG